MTAPRGAWALGALLTGLGSCADPPRTTPTRAAETPTEPRATKDVAKADPGVREAPRKDPDPAAYVGRHVLIGDRARLYTAPHPDAASAVMHLQTGEGGDRPRARTVEVLAHDGEFLSVRAARPADRCTPELPGLAAFDLQLWIRTDALVPTVTAKTLTAAPNGDVVTLSPGTPLTVEDGATQVALAGESWAIRVPADHIGTAFSPGSFPNPDSVPDVLGEGPPVRWGGREVAENLLLGRPIAAAEVDGNPQLVRVLTPCATLDAHRPSARTLQPKPARRTGPDSDIVGMPGRNGPTWKTAAGQPVFWPDGSPAGTTRAPQTFVDAPKTTNESVRRACFRVAVMARGRQKRVPPDDAWLEVCVDASSVSEHTPGLPGPPR